MNKVHNKYKITFRENYVVPSPLCTQKRMHAYKLRILKYFQITTTDAAAPAAVYNFCHSSERNSGVII